MRACTLLTVRLFSNFGVSCSQISVAIYFQPLATTSRAAAPEGGPGQANARERRPGSHAQRFPARFSGRQIATRPRRLSQFGRLQLLSEPELIRCTLPQRAFACWLPVFRLARLST